jgi:indolepyruvate ferredoxin oxidoreductase
MTIGRQAICGYTSPGSAAARDTVRSKKRPAGELPVPSPPPDRRRYSVYFTGIGGTGVVTANRILAAAAEAAGLVVGGLDQTGLSQKAGAVVSHLHLARSRGDLGAAAVETADLYLSGDILQAASARHLERIRPGRTAVVVDSAVTPTVAMLQGGAAAPAVSDMKSAIRSRAGAVPADGERADAGPADGGPADSARADGGPASAGPPVAFVDAKHIAEAVFSDHLLANVLLLGAAFQVGALPVSLADVDRAMRRQGRTAGVNREAFEWGRWAVHDPAAVSSALSGSGGADSDEAARRDPFDPSPRALEVAAGLVTALSLEGDLRDRVLRRMAQVCDYQSAALARRYVGLVGRAVERDCASRGWKLTSATAEAWFKLLTYKDEYEVARLHRAADYGPGRVTYHLHPPVLRRLGMSRKLPLGVPYALAFGVLARMKRLRGTPLDVFGCDRDRRLERSLITEFAGLTDAAGSYDSAVALAESVQSIKGYAAVKEASVAAWRDHVALLLSDHPGAGAVSQASQ